MMKKRRLIISAILILGGLGLVAVVSRKAMQEAYRNRQIEREIQTLQEEADKVRRDNRDLQEKIVYFETREFQEREAKEKLNFQKEDEKVVVVRPSPSQDIGEEKDTKEKEGKKERENISNYKKWWNFFFKY